ncbi:hypothetical protein BD410DRAFT_792937 [Rickenella mellea]|uniref:Uncharacterized protein n=1 Tax=Rickenella mellea TaxID=50990 RepID=A0A4Y7PTL9_9AGAM|nr:hypothetical protein BD410DRAFT_792937 [Rickenella mellea]
MIVETFVDVLAFPRPLGDAEQSKRVEDVMKMARTTSACTYEIYSLLGQDSRFPVTPPKSRPKTQDKDDLERLERRQRHLLDAITALLTRGHETFAAVSTCFPANFDVLIKAEVAAVANPTLPPLRKGKKYRTGPKLPRVSLWQEVKSESEEVSTAALGWKCQQNHRLESHLTSIADFIHDYSVSVHNNNRAQMNRLVLSFHKYLVATCWAKMYRRVKKPASLALIYVLHSISDKTIRDRHPAYLSKNLMENDGDRSDERLLRYIDGSHGPTFLDELLKSRPPKLDENKQSGGPAEQGNGSKPGDTTDRFPHLSMALRKAGPATWTAEAAIEFHHLLVCTLIGQGRALFDLFDAMKLTRYWHRESHIDVTAKRVELLNVILNSRLMSHHLASLSELLKIPFESYSVQQHGMHLAIFYPDKMPTPPPTPPPTSTTVAENGVAVQGEEAEIRTSTHTPTTASDSGVAAQGEEAEICTPTPTPTTAGDSGVATQDEDEDEDSEMEEEYKAEPAIATDVLYAKLLAIYVRHREALGIITRLIKRKHLPLTLKFFLIDEPEARPSPVMADWRSTIEAAYTTLPELSRQEMALDVGAALRKAFLDPRNANTSRVRFLSASIFKDCDLKTLAPEKVLDKFTANYLFRGVFHCEAVIAALMAANLTDTLVADDPLNELIKAMDSSVIGVSKLTCPTCSIVLETLKKDVSRHGKAFPVEVRGSHHVVYACDIPPWIGEHNALQVLRQLREELHIALELLQNEYLRTEEELTRQRSLSIASSEGSVSGQSSCSEDSVTEVEMADTIYEDDTERVPRVKRLIARLDAEADKAEAERLAVKSNKSAANKFHPDEADMDQDSLRDRHRG